MSYSIPYERPENRLGEYGIKKANSLNYIIPSNLNCKCYSVSILITHCRTDEALVN